MTSTNTGSTVLSLCILAGGIRGGEEDRHLTAIRWLLSRGAHRNNCRSTRLDTTASCL